VTLERDPRRTVAFTIRSSTLTRGDTLPSASVYAAVRLRRFHAGRWELHLVESHDEQHIQGSISPVDVK